MPSQFETSTFRQLLDKINRPVFTCTDAEAEELLKIARERIAERRQNGKVSQLEALADELGFELVPKVEDC